MTDRVLAEKLFNAEIKPWYSEANPNHLEDCYVMPGDVLLSRVQDWNPSSNPTQLAQCFKKAGYRKIVDATEVWMKSQSIPTQYWSYAIAEWQLAKTKEKADALAEVVRGGE